MILLFQKGKSFIRSEFSKKRKLRAPLIQQHTKGFLQRAEIHAYSFFQCICFIVTHKSSFLWSLSSVYNSTAEFYILWNMFENNDFLRSNTAIRTSFFGILIRLKSIHWIVNSYRRSKLGKLPQEVFATAPPLLLCCAVSHTLSDAERNVLVITKPRNSLSIPEKVRASQCRYKILWTKHIWNR